MSDINSPEFRRRAAEAAQQRAAEEQQRQREAAANIARATEAKQRTDREMRLREQRINGQGQTAQQLARVALANGIAINRQWIVTKSHNFTLANRLMLGRVLQQGWLLQGTYHSRPFDDGIETWREEVVLTTNGGLIKTHGPYSNEGITDFDKLYVHSIPHPSPKEYVTGSLLPRPGLQAYVGMTLDKVDDALDVVDLGLAEFAGVHKLV